jgi:hypothetical protein
MANELANYDPTFYAAQSLIWLQKVLGMAGRVYRGYDKTPTQKGSVISIRRPATFTALAAPQTAQNLEAAEVQVLVDQWFEVKYALTDKELNYTQEQVIQEHIQPAAYALADKIDQQLVALYKDIPWSNTNASPLVVADITANRRILNVNQAPNDMNRHLMLSPTQEEEALNLSAFTQHQGAGESGVLSQMRGTLGMKYGYEVFMNQNVPSHTTGVSADATGALTAAGTKGDTAISFDSVTSGGTFKKGDSFVIAGNTQRYVFTADFTASGGAKTDAPIFPALVQDYDNLAVVTITLLAGEQGLGFHRNAFALAMAPLSDRGDGAGARIATVADPVTGLTLRSRYWYDGDASSHFVSVDALWGVKTLDPNLACRLVN